MFPSSCSQELDSCVPPLHSCSFLALEYSRVNCCTQSCVSDSNPRTDRYAQSCFFFFFIRRIAVGMSFFPMSFPINLVFKLFCGIRSKFWWSSTTSGQLLSFVVGRKKKILSWAPLGLFLLITLSMELYYLKPILSTFPWSSPRVHKVIHVTSRMAIITMTSKCWNRNFNEHLFYMLF